MPCHQLGHGYQRGAALDLCLQQLGTTLQFAQRVGIQMRQSQRRSLQNAAQIKTAVV